MLDDDDDDVTAKTLDGHIAECHMYRKLVKVELKNIKSTVDKIDSRQWLQLTGVAATALLVLLDVVLNALKLK